MCRHGKGTGQRHPGQRDCDKNDRSHDCLLGKRPSPSAAEHYKKGSPASLVEERIKDALQQFWCRGVLPAWSIAAKIRAHTRRSRNERTQGIGQALLEHAVYDPDSGQLLSGSFMDYTMPRAGDVPPFAFSTHNVPSTANPLGVKGAGEAGAVGAPPAVITLSSTLSTVVLGRATSICQRRRAVYGKCSMEFESLREFASSGGRTSVTAYQP
jgi:Molybdopterin-binding domain of aldehyde dehydrogenase